MKKFFKACKKLVEVDEETLYYLAICSLELNKF